MEGKKEEEEEEKKSNFQKHRVKLVLKNHLRFLPFTKDNTNPKSDFLDP